MTVFSESAVEQTQQEAVDLSNPILTNSAFGQAGDVPIVLEAESFAEIRQEENVLIVDVRSPEQCVDGHIPGAVMLEYSALVAQKGLATGLLPSAAYLSRTLSTIGLTAERHVIAYNDDNGSHAARLLWTLEVIGHSSYSLLNGGFAAWDELDLPVVSAPDHPSASDYNALIQTHKYADFEYVMEKIGDADTVLLDTRSPDEFHGKQIRAKRGGHIPGAINFDWTLAIDQFDNGRLLRDAELLVHLHELGITPDKEIIPYCQTHHRSAHTSVVLKHLGFPRVRAYAGSWSEWGNRPEAPVTL